MPIRLSTSSVNPRKPNLSVKFSRPSEAPEARVAWRNQDELDSFTEVDFLAVNGAYVGKSNLMLLPELPTGVVGHTGSVGLWIAGPLRPIFIGDTAAFGGAFNYIGTHGTRGPHMLTVNGTAGIYYATNYNTAFAGQLTYTPFSARYAPRNDNYGVLYPIVSGNVQAYLDTVVGDPTEIPVGLKVAVHPSGIFYK